MGNNQCEHEYKTVKYFASQLSEIEKASAEEHIASCPQCCETIAQLTKIMFVEETPEEKAFLDVHAKDVQGLHLLVKKSLETSNTAKSNVVTLQTKILRKKVPFLPWKISYLSVAISIAFIFIASVVVMSLVNHFSSPEYQIAQGFSELHQANKNGRLINFRLENFEYAQPAKSRGKGYSEVQRHLTKAEEILQKQIDRLPKPETFNLLAEAKLMNKKYSEALAILDKGISLYPQNQALYTTLAATNFANKNFVKALANINKVLDLNPNSLSGLFNRGLVYKELQEYDKARSDWETCLKLDPSLPWKSEIKENLPNLH